MPSRQIDPRLKARGIQAGASTESSGKKNLALFRSFQHQNRLPLQPLPGPRVPRPPRKLFRQARRCSRRPPRRGPRQLPHRASRRPRHRDPPSLPPRLLQGRRFPSARPRRQPPRKPRQRRRDRRQLRRPPHRPKQLRRPSLLPGRFLRPSHQRRQQRHRNRVLSLKHRHSWRLSASWSLSSHWAPSSTTSSRNNRLPPQPPSTRLSN